MLSPYPGWTTVSQSVLDQTAGELVRGMGGMKAVAYCGWSAPNGAEGLLLIAIGRLPKGYPPGLRGAPSYVRTAFAKGVCSTNGGIRSGYGTIVASPLSMVGMCKHKYQGGFISVAVATTRSNLQEFPSRWVGSHCPNLSCSRWLRGNFKLCTKASSFVRTSLAVLSHSSAGM